MILDSSQQSFHLFIVTDEQLKSQETPRLSTVVVHGIPMKANSEFVKLFFESKRQSGGGHTTHVDYAEGTGEAVVTFANAAGKWIWTLGSQNTFHPP